MSDEEIRAAINEGWLAELDDGSFEWYDFSGNLIDTHVGREELPQ